jgi:peptidoglycan/xylan/chitin deacetylase (PgdA/CDA1 family)
VAARIEGNLGNCVKAAPKFVISLDFELMWGVRDHSDIRTYGANVSGVRAAIPRMLDLFEWYSIRATWATVGFVFCESKDELIASAPSLQPSYTNQKLSNYRYFPEVGEREDVDPYYYGASIIRRIVSCPGQEIGSHSFSHYYCLEPGQTLIQFEADVRAANAIAQQRGIALKSFVFPRNQYSLEHLEVLKRNGFRVFRGNERAWAYRPTDGLGQSKLRRACRLADQYVNITGHHVYDNSIEGGLIEVPASRFLRPYSRRLSKLDRLRLNRITAAIDKAAATNRTFHLWWHPHNFGLDLDENLNFLNLVLAHFSRQRDRYGMASANMGDFV